MSEISLQGICDWQGKQKVSKYLPMSNFTTSRGAEYGAVWADIEFAMGAEQFIRHLWNEFQKLVVVSKTVGDLWSHLQKFRFRSSFFQI